MQELEKMLAQELEQLEKNLKLLDQRIAKYPEESLVLGSTGGYTQYYYRVKKANDSNNQKHYIKRDNLEFAKLLAQKDYDMRLKNHLKAKYNCVKNCHEQYKKENVLDLYDNLHPGRKKLVEPLYISNTEYAKQWQDISWQKKPFADGTAEIYTVKGERVRSKSEKILADYFEREGIPYRYEYPVRLPGNRIIHPDFMLLNVRTRKEYYLEHLGQMDNPEYAVNAITRLEEMAKNGIVQGRNLLLTAETSKHPLSMVVVRSMVEEFLR